MIGDKRKVWVTAVIIKDKNNNCKEYYVHGEHEYDMIQFLFKKEETSNYISYPAEKKKETAWFYFILTKEDINEIKETTWYRNASYGNENLDLFLKENNEIEVIMDT